jgi:hypothetical protein
LALKCTSGGMNAIDPVQPSGRTTASSTTVRIIRAHGVGRASDDSRIAPLVPTSSVTDPQEVGEENRSEQRVHSAHPLDMAEDILAQLLAWPR